jgi:hypothetical protein
MYDINQLIETIDDSLYNIRCKIDGHRSCVKHYTRLNIMFELPVTIILAIIAIVVGYSPIDSSSGSDGLAYKWSISGISGVTILLQVIRKYCDFEKKISAHSSGSKSYNHLLHTIESRIIDIDRSYDALKNLHKEITTSLSIIDQYDISIPEAIQEKVKSKIKTNSKFDTYKKSITDEKIKEEEIKQDDNKREEVKQEENKKEPISRHKRTPSPYISPKNLIQHTQPVQIETIQESPTLKLTSIIKDISIKANIIDEAKSVLEKSGQNVKHIRNPSREFLTKLNGNIENV